MSHVQTNFQFHLMIPYHMAKQALSFVHKLMIALKIFLYQVVSFFFVGIWIYDKKKSREVLKILLNLVRI